MKTVISSLSLFCLLIITISRGHAGGTIESLLLDSQVPKENQVGVYANQKFTRILDEYGVEYFAEEYRGNTWNKKWIEYGRVETEMLPFFQRFLKFK